MLSDPVMEWGKCLQAWMLQKRIDAAVRRAEYHSHQIERCRERSQFAHASMRWWMKLVEELRARQKRKDQ